MRGSNPSAIESVRISNADKTRSDWPIKHYLNFRYDPYGNQVIAAEAGVSYDSDDSDNSGIQEHGLARSNYTTASVQGDVQVILFHEGVIGYNDGAPVTILGRHRLTNQGGNTRQNTWSHIVSRDTKDNTSSLADGTDSQPWGVLEPLTIKVEPCPASGCGDDSSGSVNDEASNNKEQVDNIIEDDSDDDFDSARQDVIDAASEKFSDSLSKEQAENFVNNLLDEASKQLGISVEELPRNVSDAMLYNIGSHINGQNSTSEVKKAFRRDFYESVLEASLDARLDAIPTPFTFSASGGVFSPTVQFTPDVGGGGGLGYIAIGVGVGYLADKLTEALMDRTNDGKSDSDSNSERDTSGETANPSPNPEDPDKDPEGKEKRRLERLAKKLKLNIDSPTTRQLLDNLDKTVDGYISLFRSPTIRGKVPGEFLNKTVGEALRSGNTTIRKLLTSGRDKFIK